MIFESPIARAVFVYWIVVVLSWWLPGWYRVRLGRRGELGRGWRAHQEEFESFLDSEDPEAQHINAHLLRTPLLLGIRVGVSVGWPFMMGVYFYHFVKKCSRLRRLRRFRARPR